MRPHGYAISETQFTVFIINASRRLFSDRFFTSSFRPEFYTSLGVEWVNNNGPTGVVMEQGKPNGHDEVVSPFKRVLLRTMGALNAGGGQLMSYLLFQDSYTRELIALGYQDAMKRSDDLLAFLGGFTVDKTGATQMMRRFQLRQEQRAEAQ